MKKTLDQFKNRVHRDVYNLYEQTVINKIDGKARDAICTNGNPTDFESAAEILLAIYGDRNDMSSYQAQLWSLKMEESLHIYYKKTKEIVQNMKSLAKQKELYRTHWEAINDFLDSECLAAFINGLNRNYFGYAQAANPEDIESAYAFLCKFKNAEATQKQTKNYKPFDQTKNQTAKQQNNQPYQKTGFSDRSKATPMEIDRSIRSNKIYNHDAEQEPDEKSDDDSESSEDEMQEANFQIDRGSNIWK